MCSLKRVVKAGGLFLFAVGILLTAACKSPVGGDTQRESDPPNNTPLINKIADAQALLDSLEKSEDGTDVDTDTYWVISIERWKLENAIETAQGVADSRNATAADIRDALKALTEAIDAANNAKKPGTKSVPGENPNPDPDPDPDIDTDPDTDTDPAPDPNPEPVDKSALEAKIAVAEALAASLQTSANGDDIPPNGEWVTDSVKSELTGAIQAAKDLAANENASAEDAASALSALTTAYNEANDAKKPGTTPDKTALIAKIIETVGKKENVNKSATGGSEWRVNELWVDSDIYNALETALTAAEQARDNANATKAAADAALANLITAFNNFIPQPGISVADKHDLNALIRQVAEALASVEVSDDGLDIYDDAEWVTAAEKSALEAVLAEARGIAVEPTTVQEDVDAMAGTLQAALGAFKPQFGKKAVDKLDFYITFNKPGDETITLGPDQTLSWLLDDTLHITAAETFASYQWYVDGAVKNGETGRSFTLQAKDFARGSTHTVTLKVTKGGVPYTKALTFRVN